jgi:hypothetical protein
MLAACVPDRPSPQTPQQPQSVGLANDASPTIHFIITGDTNNRYNCVQAPEKCPEEIISKGFAANVGTMRDISNEIARLPTAPGVAPVKINAVVITGEQFTCENIDRAIDGLPVRPGIDVIWFHHSGHGMNTGSGPDPEFQLLQCGPFRPLSDFRARILAKKPRLALIFADSCNIGGSVAGPPLAAAPVLVNYLPLLTNYTGWLMGGAASPGEFSWYTAYGGTYTTNLTLVIRSVSYWDQVITSPTLKELDTAGAANTRQHPIFKSALQRL